MVRRPDKQLIQMPPLLYLVIEQIDGSRGFQEIGDAVGERVGRELAADDVGFLIDEKLRPLGLIETEGAAGPPQVEAVTPLLALRLRKAVISERTVGTWAGLFSPLFWLPVVVLVIGGFVAFDAWLFFSHGVAHGLHEALYQPGLLLMMLGLVVLAAIFHEIGHAAGCRYSGAEPGVMGVGFYIVWPAFYTDVTDAYRLRRGGRLRTDLGGVYFNALFILALFGLFALTGLESLLLATVVIQFEMVHQMLPFLRLDGYYVVADLVGVPDLFQRIRPILWSFVPWAPTDERVTELKSWVRFAVTGWVLAVVPFIVLQVVMIVMAVPRIIGTAWDSFRGTWDRTSVAFGDGRWLVGMAGIVQFLLLILPLAGILYLFVMFGVRFVRGWRDTKGRPVARSMLSLTGVAFLTFVALAWWPDPPSRYRPIEEGEQWTVPEFASALVALPSGGEGIGVTGVDTSESGAPTADQTPIGTGSGTTSSSPTPSPSADPSPTPSPSASTSPSVTPSPTASVSPTVSPSP
jgi:putative peptide zinc metalloprotease protein